MRIPILGGPITSQVGDAESRLSGGEFAALVRGAARHLAERGTGTGEHLAVDVEGPLDQLAWFLGADVVGGATLIVEPSWSDREHRAVLDDARPARVLDHSPEPFNDPDFRTADTSVDPANFGHSGKSSNNSGTSNNSEKFDDAGKFDDNGEPSHTGKTGHAGNCAAGPRPIGDESTRFYLPTTSGSSGHPRVLARNRRSWLDSYAAFDLGIHPRETVLVPGPLSSSLFLFAALHALHEGHDLQLLRRWSAAEAAEECRRSTVIHVVPAMLSALLAVWEREPALREQCALTAIVCGGARLDDAVRQQAHRVLPTCRIVEYYGAAEHSLIAIDHGEGELRPVVDVDVRDEHGESAPAGRAGQLWTRSGLVFDGYLEGGALDRRSPAPGAEWLSVGDRATRHADGTLVVHGRSSSTIASGGTLVSAEEVESALRSGEGVLDVLACPTPHERFGEIVTAVLETRCGSPSLRELRALARAELEPAKRPRRWLRTAELPRTAAGKPARALVAERLRAGTLDAHPLHTHPLHTHPLDKRPRNTQDRDDPPAPSEEAPS